MSTAAPAHTAPAERRADGPAPTARPPLRVVDVRRGHPLLWTLLAVGVLAGAVLVAVTFTALAAEGTVAARTLEAQVDDAEGTYTELLAEVAAMEDPARIADAAERLGLVRAERPRQLVVERVLPADGAGRAAAVDPGETTDRLKPLLADDRL